MIRFLTFLFLLLPGFLSAQIGGRHIYDFLNLVPQARLAAVGGSNISTMDWDHTFAYQNPSLLNDSMHNRVSLSYVNYLGGINYGYAAYARKFEKIGIFHAGIQYVNYGKMVRADEYGNQTGDFSANDVVLVVGGARKVYLFNVGANLKFINSNIAGYNSFSAFALDIAGTYQSKDKLLAVALVFKNMGVQLQKFTATGKREPLPFELQAGVSYKLKYMPLRLSITAINLEHPRLFYKDPNPEPQFDLAGNEIKPKNNTVNDIFSHFVFGAEFLIGKNINIRAGYNHQRRVELRSLNKAGISGFTFGAGVQLLKFRLDYAYAHFHAVGGTHNLTLSMNIDEVKERFGRKAK